ERQEAQGVLAVAERRDDRLLGEQEARRRRLHVVERMEEAVERPVSEVEREARLVAPERPVVGEPGDAGADPEADDRPDERRLARYRDAPDRAPRLDLRDLGRGRHYLTISPFSCGLRARHASAKVQLGRARGRTAPRFGAE